MHLDLLNPWLVTILGGIVVIVVGRFFLKGEKKIPTDQKSSQNVFVNTNVSYDKTESVKEKHLPEPEEDIVYLKAKTQILFIDNEFFEKINNLRKVGWKISYAKNVTNPDNESIRAADIIFVDYLGVGQKLSDDQGLGLISILKQRYGSAKWLVLYSAHTSFALNVFDRGADSYLSKNSAVYEIEQKIIEGARKVVR